MEAIPPARVRRLRGAGAERSEPDRSLWEKLTASAALEERRRAWLALQCRSIPGVRAGILVLEAPDGAYAPAAAWPEPGRTSRALTAAAAQALAKRRPSVEAAPAGTAGRDSSAVALPVQSGERLLGAVAVELEPHADPEAALAALAWGSAWVESLLPRDAASASSGAEARFETVLRLLATALEHERFPSVATAFVTELATRLGCDRASFGSAQRERIVVSAVSHSSHVARARNLNRGIEAAMDETLERRRTIVWPGEPAAPEHEALAREAGSCALLSVLLARGERPSGVLILERSAERPFTADEIALVEAAADLAGPLLELQRREDRWLPAKVADGARHALESVTGPGRAGRKLVLALVIAAAAFLVFARGHYRVTADAELEAAELRAAVAPFDGFIASGRVRAGDVVRAGQELGSLDERELRLEHARWSSQHEQLVRKHRQALASHEAAETVILSAQLDQAAAQLALLEDQLSRIRLVSRLDGVVVKGDLSQRLGAPVERGEVLFEVAPLDAYRLVLQVDERQVADVRVGQRGTLVLSALPEESLGFELTNVTAVAAAEEGTNTFRVEARLDRTPERLRPGMKGVGKIEAGERKLFWIWTHEIVDWARLAFWSWLP